MKHVAHFLEHSASWGIYALLATPLLFSNRFLFPAMSPKLLWLFFVSELTFMLCVWVWSVQPSTRPKASLLLILFSVLLAVFAFSAGWGVYPLNSFWGSLETNTSFLVWAHLGLVLLSLFTVARTPKAWINIATVATVVGLLVSILHLFSLFSETIRIGFNSGSTLGNSSFLGTYLLFEFFFAGYLALCAIGWVRRLGILGLLVFLYTLFFTDATAALWSVLGGGLLYASILLLASRQKFQRLIGGITLLGLGLFFICAVVLAYQENNTLHTWIIEHSSGSRFVVADLAWESFLERPVFGWGPENFRFAFLSHFDPCFGGSYCGDNILFDRAHNVFLDLLVTVGLVGFVAYVALWIGMFFQIWKACRRKVLSIPVMALVVSVLAGYVVQNLTVFDTAISLLLFVFVYGFVGSFADLSLHSAKVHKAIPVLATMLLPVSLFFFVLEPLQGVASVKVATTNLHALTRFEAYQTAVSLSVLGRDVRRDFLALQTANLLWDYDPVSQAQVVTKLKPYFVQELALAQSALLDTLAQSPNDVRGYLYLLKLLQVQGRLYDKEAFAKARQVLNEARARNPKQVIFLWVEVALRLEQADQTGAQAKAQEAVTLAPNHTATQRNLKALEAYLHSSALVPAQRQALLAQFYLD